MINFFSEDVSFNLENHSEISVWIENIIIDHERLLGELSFIFCSDNYLLEINKKHLNHDYYTDIITFDYCIENTISGDIFISIDRIKENAQKFSQDFNKELYRVISHGILHLIGFKDKSKKEQEEMRRQEDECLRILNF